MSELPSYVGAVFVATVAATFGFLFFGLQSAQKRPSNLPVIITALLVGAWLATLAWLAQSGFFLAFDSFPPRLIFALLPPVLVIGIVLSFPQSRRYLFRIPITTLTYLHLVRVPVEIVLWWLAGSKLLPYLLTFEGINYDILSGVTAPFVAIFLVGARRKNRLGAITWNIIALGLLINIVGHAILAAPTPFQQLAFDQPNIAVFYFPFIWLPGFVVPAVLFAHLVGLIKLFEKQKNLI